MRRREFIGLVAAAASNWPLAARAQQAKGALRVGMVGFAPRTSPLVAAFSRRWAELGYREGEDIIFDYVQSTGADKALEDAYREHKAYDEIDVTEVDHGD